MSNKTKQNDKIVTQAPIENSAALFSGAYRDEGIEPAEFLGTFGVTGHRDCEPQRPGFNTQCNGGNAARWGL